MTQNVIENLFPIPVYVNDGYTLDSKNKDAFNTFFKGKLTTLPSQLLTIGEK
jgi:hypothetical protein